MIFPVVSMTGPSIPEGPLQEQIISKLPTSVINPIFIVRLHLFCSVRIRLVPLLKIRKPASPFFLFMRRFYGLEYPGVFR